MPDWIPAPRYRGRLVRAKCPCCGFLIACLLQEDPWDEPQYARPGFHLGRALSCPHCLAKWREQIWLT